MATDLGDKKLADALFQSHIGAIRILIEDLDEFDYEIFQSHIGAIRIDSFSSAFSSFNNFNPTLVQLE